VLAIGRAPVHRNVALGCPLPYHCNFVRRHRIESKTYRPRCSPSSPRSALCVPRALEERRPIATGPDNGLVLRWRHTAGYAHALARIVGAEIRAGLERRGGHQAGSLGPSGRFSDRHGYDARAIRDCGSTRCAFVNSSGRPSPSPRPGEFGDDCVSFQSPDTPSRK